MGWGGGRLGAALIEDSLQDPVERFEHLSGTHRAATPSPSPPPQGGRE
jgi:hypothetical protein